MVSCSNANYTLYSWREWRVWRATAQVFAAEGASVIVNDISDEWAQAMIAAIPLGRIAEPQVVARTALFLAS